MINDYAAVKFFHILIAILALGTSAGLGIILEIYGDHPTHGVFMLRAIRRVVLFFVLPGYLLMLGTGLWMVSLAWPLTTRWVEIALALWGLGALLLGITPAVLGKQISLFDAAGPTSTVYRKVALFGRALGAGTGVVVIGLLYLMVFKPELA